MVRSARVEPARARIENKRQEESISRKRERWKGDLVGRKEGKGTCLLVIHQGFICFETEDLRGGDAGPRHSKKTREILLVSQLNGIHQVSEKKERRKPARRMRTTLESELSVFLARRQRLFCLLVDEFQALPRPTVEPKKEESGITAGREERRARTRRVRARILRALLYSNPSRASRNTRKSQLKSYHTPFGTRARGKYAIVRLQIGRQEGRLADSSSAFLLPSNFHPPLPTNLLQKWKTLAPLSPPSHP